MTGVVLSIAKSTYPAPTPASLAEALRAVADRIASGEHATDNVLVCLDAGGVFVLGKPIGVVELVGRLTMTAYNVALGDG